MINTITLIFLLALICIAIALLYISYKENDCLFNELNKSFFLIKSLLKQKDTLLKHKRMSKLYNISLEKRIDELEKENAKLKKSTITNT